MKACSEAVSLQCVWNYSQVHQTTSDSNQILHQHNIELQTNFQISVESGDVCES